VPSQWTDRDAGGQSRTDSITWVLRKEPGGWRISGMRAIVLPGEPAVEFNFEDPEEMLRQQAAIQEKVRTSQTPPAGQPAQPPRHP
jgi:hypothetical protein